MTYADLLQQLIALRKGRGLTQGDLADRLRIKRAIIGHREQQRSYAGLDELTMWADVLGADLHIELVTDRRRLAAASMADRIQQLDPQRLQLMRLMLEVLPDLDEGGMRSLMLLLDAYQREQHRAQIGSK